MRTFISTQYTPNGNAIEVFDYRALQTEMNGVDSALTVLQQSVLGIDERIAKLEDTVKTLERLVTFCATRYPEVVNEFLVTERTKIRLETGA